MKKTLAILSFMSAIAIAACGSKDDDGQPSGPSITALPVSQAEGNDATFFDFKITLASASKKTVTLDYATRNKTAKAGTDFLATSGSISFAAGETEKTIAVTILPDIWKETDETFELALSNPVNGILANSTVLATIVNDDDQESDEGYTTPDNYAGYNLVWQDEFNGTSIDETSWIHEEGASGWGQQRTAGLHRQVVQLLYK